MAKIPVLVAGLPGRMATLVAQRILRSEKYELVPFAFTGPETAQPHVQLEGIGCDIIQLVKPAEQEKAIEEVLLKKGDFVVVDYTQPDAVEANAKLYCANKLPFVMGTTGGNRDAIKVAVMDSLISAVVDVNMSIPVIVMKSMLEKAAAEFPGALAGFTARIDESHQSTKKDKSGTAIAIGKNLAALGVAKVGEADIIPIRDRKEQLAWGVPENALDGHGWHNYRLTSEDESVTLGFVHNVNGRQTYVDGTMRALDFLVKEFEDHNSIGQCYSMIDVMRG